MTPTDAKAKSQAELLTEAFGSGARIDRSLPAGGRIHIDRPLPYLLVHRRPAEAKVDDVEALISGEASIALLPDRADALREQREMIRAIARAGVDTFGAFLVIELWEEPLESGCFRIRAPDQKKLASVQALEKGLVELGGLGRDVDVIVEERDDRQAPGREPLLTVSECHELGVLLVGLGVPPLHIGEGGARYPIYFRALRRAFSRVLRESIFAFVRVQTDAGISNYRMLGRRRLDDAVWDADRELAKIEATFDLLMLVSPVNETEAWELFKRGGFEKVPEYRYRLLPFDPDLTKRRLYAIQLEHITDPAAGWLLRDKREEIDRQISLLSERNTPSFLASSVRLFGSVDEALHLRAEALLEAVPPVRTKRSSARVRVGATAFATRALEEIEMYREDHPKMGATVQVRPDLVGLMVSRGHLLIGDTLALRPGRVDALIQHEVGTHVVTYWNGSAQPFEQLATGLAGYDEFQEGLAVFAEYLTGGLDGSRMRLLAARVLAVQALLDGADFLETFAMLTREAGFTRRTAFNVTSRVYQSGGFTRDMIYLRGLVDLIELVQGGADIGPFFIGKLARRHIDVLAELSDRGVLVKAPLVPRFLRGAEAAGRLHAVREGLPLAAMTSTEEEEP